MGIVFKTILFGLIASVFISYYGDEIVHVLTNEAVLSSDKASGGRAAASGIVNTVQVPMHRDGHYWLDVNVNGNRTRFVVDTGATYMTLSYDDARRLDIPYFESDYNIVVNTAAGQTTMAEVTLDVVNVDAIELYDVKAFIAREGMLSVSLLGMNFLNRLDRFEFVDQQLILEQ